MGEVEALTVEGGATISVQFFKPGRLSYSEPLSARLHPLRH